MAKGAPSFGSCSEIYLKKAFMDADIHQRDSLLAARELGETSLMFLVHPTLSEKDMTADAAERVLAEASL
jgi:dTDP-4-amino-4,6-dideoxygalactose transaminase